LTLAACSEKRRSCALICHLLRPFWVRSLASAQATT
jgi:hypothetical protein